MDYQKSSPIGKPGLSCDIMAQQPRLLIVDDNDGDRMLLREAIRDTGWNADIVEASTSRQAIEALNRDGLKQTPPDLILTDFRLSGEPCVAMIRAIRAIPGYESVPIIVMSTTKPPAAETEQCHSLGVLKVLVKAHEYTPLLKMVATLRRMLVGKGSISRGGSWIGDSDLAQLGDEA
jgi:CheY-like chemotaxis protein